MKYLTLLSGVVVGMALSTASFAQSSNYYNAHNHYNNAGSDDYTAVATPGTYDYPFVEPRRRSRSVEADAPAATVAPAPWYYNHAKGSAPD